MNARNAYMSARRRRSVELEERRKSMGIDEVRGLGSASPPPRPPPVESKKEKKAREKREKTEKKAETKRLAKERKEQAKADKQKRKSEKAVKKSGKTSSITLPPPVAKSTPLEQENISTGQATSAVAAVPRLDHVEREVILEQVSPVQVRSTQEGEQSAPAPAPQPSERSEEERQREEEALAFEKEWQRVEELRLAQEEAVARERQSHGHVGADEQVAVEQVINKQVANESHSQQGSIDIVLSKEGSGTLGIGLQTLRDVEIGTLVIVSSLQPGSPADLDGRLKPGMHIIRVDGESVRDKKQCALLMGCGIQVFPVLRCRSSRAI